MKGGQLARCVRDRERGGLVQNESLSFSFFMSEKSQKQLKNGDILGLGLNFSILK